MFRKNDGKNYESLIKYVYDELSNYSGQDIEVKRNIKIKGKSGCEHQIDVYYEFILNDIKHKVIIECKDYKGKVEIGAIEKFKGVLNDIGGCKGIFASRNGFQSGAINFANHYDIELVKGGELPLLSKILIKRIEVLLPNEKVSGEPFWTIMEERNGQLTGEYMCIGEEILGLFISKKVAQQVCDNIGGVVRGISQRHLRTIIQYGYNFNLKLCFVPIELENGLIVEPKFIEDYFCYS